MQHQAGARSLGAQTALVLADTRVGRIVAASRAAGTYASTTFVVVSDHGFKTFKQRIRGNVLLQSRGLGDVAWAIAEGGTAMIYVTGAGLADKPRTIAAIKAAVTGADGVAEVLTPEDFARTGFPSPDRLPRMADVVVAAKDGVAFIDGTDGPAIEAVPPGANTGAHGYLNTDPDMRAIFIAAGAGVKRGATLGTIRNLDVAPTIAAWLGVALPSATGRVLPIVQ
jgi:predicted AlkP superfamily pyrophosphatase or phosphodiesterase